MSKDQEFDIVPRLESLADDFLSQLSSPAAKEADPRSILMVISLSAALRASAHEITTLRRKLAKYETVQFVRPLTEGEKEVAKAAGTPGDVVDPRLAGLEPGKAN